MSQFSKVATLKITDLKNKGERGVTIKTKYPMLGQVAETGLVHDGVLLSICSGTYFLLIAGSAIVMCPCFYTAVNLTFICLCFAGTGFVDRNGLLALGVVQRLLQGSTSGLDAGIWVAVAPTFKPVLAVSWRLTTQRLDLRRLILLMSV